jgi:hypothetical protein
MVHEQQSRFSFLKSKTGVAMVAFLAIAAFYLITEHTAHVFGLLPYGLLFLCPLLHLFMHSGHGDHGGHSDNVENHAQHSEGGQR